MKIKRRRKREELDDLVTLVYAHGTDEIEQIDISLASAPPPQLMYSAEDVLIEVRGEMLYLHFVQMLPLGSGVASVLTVTIDIHVLPDLLRTAERMRGTLRELLEREDYKLERYDLDEALKEHPTKYHQEKATVARMAFRGAEAEIEWFVISPSGMHHTAQSRQSDRLLRPCVATLIHSKLLQTILDRMEELTQNLEVNDESAEE